MSLVEDRADRDGKGLLAILALPSIITSDFPVARDFGGCAISASGAFAPPHGFEVLDARFACGPAAIDFDDAGHRSTLRPEPAATVAILVAGMAPDDTTPGVFDLAPVRQTAVALGMSAALANSRELDRCKNRTVASDVGDIWPTATIGMVDHSLTLPPKCMVIGYDFLAATAHDGLLDVLICPVLKHIRLDRHQHARLTTECRLAPQHKLITVDVLNNVHDRLVTNHVADHTFYSDAVTNLAEMIRCFARLGGFNDRGHLSSPPRNPEARAGGKSPSGKQECSRSRVRQSSPKAYNSSFMSGEFSGGKGGGPTPFTNAFKPSSVASLRYNTSQAGSPVPLVYGTQRVSINLIELWGQAGGLNQSTNSKGGKGIGSSTGKKGSTGSNYSVDVAFGVCQGPVSYLGSPHGLSGNNQVWANGTVAGANTVGLNYYLGNDGQAADPVFLSSDSNTPVVGYSGTSYVTGTPMQLGSTPALPNLSFEISGFGSTANGGAGCGPGFPGDANPTFIVTDLLTNPRYGAGFPAANLDTAGSLADFGTYCQAAGLAMSLLLDRCQPCARWLEEIAELTVSAVLWSGSLLKIIPYGDQTLTSNGATWNPNLTWQYSLGDADLIDFGGGTDPVVITRSDPTAATNWLSLEYQDANNNYNPQILPVWDQGLIDQFGTRTAPSIQAHEFTNAAGATISATLMLQRKAYIRNTFKFKLGFRYSLLEPMDIVLLTDATTGLSGAAVRITQIDEDDNGEMTVTAEEIPGVTP